MTETSLIGKSMIRTDSVAKATGQAIYTADLKLPRMLVGKVLRSPYPHARILNIDTTRAERLKGVKAVITGKDGYDIKWGVFPYTQDHAMIPTDKVRYIGEEVAAVAAVDEETAMEALSLIEVEYEELPAVFTVEEAMKDGAPLIHDQYKNNINVHVHIEVGEVEKAFSEADIVLEDRFEAAGEMYGMMEPYAVVAYYTPEGYLDIYMPNAGPHVRAKALSNLLKMPLNKIRVRHINSGGAFGGRSEISPGDFVTSLLTIKSGRPVKLVYTREETSIATRQVHDIIAHIKTGAKKDGTIIAKEFKVYYNGGAYSSTGPIATSIPFYVYEETYRLPNLRYDGYRVLTNRPIRGMYRCHGRAFLAGNAMHMDKIAEEIGMDPTDIRIKNGIRAGEVTATGSKIISCGLEDTIKAAAKKSGWKKKRGKLPPYHGIGMGCLAIMCGFPMGFRSGSSAYVRVNEDGAATVISGVVDNGQGNESVVVQIAAHALGIPVSYVNLICSDTEATTHDPGAYSQAAVFVSGNAVRLAAEDARDKILTAASQYMKVDKEALTIEDGVIHLKDEPETAIKVSKAVRYAMSKGNHIQGYGTYIPKISFDREWVKNPYGQMAGTFSYGTSIAEVEVDPETGIIKLLRMVVAHDCGNPINPMAVEGQLEGSVGMGGVATILEEHVWDGGLQLNSDFLEYKLPLSVDMPEIDPILIQSMDPEGPYGAKEGGLTISMSAYKAIANAVYDATGVWMRFFPYTPDRVLKALEEKKAKS